MSSCKILKALVFVIDRKYDSKYKSDQRQAEEDGIADIRADAYEIITRLLWRLIVGNARLLISVLLISALIYRDMFTTIGSRGASLRVVVFYGRSAGRAEFIVVVYHGTAMWAYLLHNATSESFSLL